MRGSIDTSHSPAPRCAVHQNSGRLMPDPSFSSSSSVVALRGGPLVHPVRNPGMPFDASWHDGLRINQSAVSAARRRSPRAAPSRKRRRPPGCSRPSPASISRHSAATTRRPCAAPMCEGASARSRRPSRSARHDAAASRRALCASITALSARPWMRSRAAAFRSRRSRPAFRPD